MVAAEGPALAALAGFVLATGLAIATPDVWRDMQRAQAFVGGPIALSVFLSNALKTGSPAVSLTIAAALITVINSLTLRRLGWRLAVSA